ncbi:hypothetical protein GYH30_045844 [Glycine max]|nr:hypothetical protein GYH30_045844 [Glycine max]
MRRKIHHPTVFRSSIVLLQERFRQLQRVKEMRKKRELLKMLTTSEPKPFNSNPTMRQFFHPELIIASRSSPPHVSLSLGPTSRCMQEYNKSTIEAPVLNNMLSIDSTHNQSIQASCKNIYDWDSGSDSSVDTSLHLESVYV